MIAGIDFSGVFERECNEKTDYEEWTPKDGKSKVRSMDIYLSIYLPTYLYICIASSAFHLI